MSLVIRPTHANVQLTTEKAPRGVARVVDQHYIERGKESFITDLEPGLYEIRLFVGSDDREWWTPRYALKVPAENERDEQFTLRELPA